jgi:hypothetical protein
MNVLLPILGMLLLIVAAVCGMIAWRGEGRLSAIQSTPTSTAEEIYARYRHEGGAFGQLCEVAGVVESDTSLAGPLTGQPCVIYSSTLTWEDWEQAPPLARRYADSTGMVHRGGSTQIDDRHVPAFWVRDATGRVRVDPLLADLDLKPIDQRYEVMTAGSGRSERRSWHTEKALPLGHQIYVLGYLHEKDGEPILASHPRDPRKKLFISYRAEHDLARATSGRTNLLYLVAGLAGASGLVMIVWRLLRR